MNRRYNRLFVSNVSQSANLDELKELFEKVGKLVHFEISNGQGSKINQKATSNSRILKLLKRL
jgi:RNA recognition motif-containing protein